MPRKRVVRLDPRALASCAERIRWSPEKNRFLLNEGHRWIYGGAPEAKYMTMSLARPYHKVVGPDLLELIISELIIQADRTVRPDKTDPVDWVLKTYCWHWQGAWDDDGIAILPDGTKAAVEFYVAAVGRIPRRKILFVLCENTMCVFPEHMVVVTKTEAKEHLETRQSLTSSSYVTPKWKQGAGMESPRFLCHECGSKTMRGRCGPCFDKVKVRATPQLKLCFYCPSTCLTGICPNCKREGKHKKEIDASATNGGTL